MQRTVARRLLPTLHPRRRPCSTAAAGPPALGFQSNHEPSPDADALARLLVAHHNAFHAMESPQQLLGIRLTNALAFQTLLRLSNLSKIALSFFSWSGSLPGFHHDLPTSLLMLDVLARVRQFDAAWHLLLRIDPPSPKPFLILARRYIAAGMTRQAIRAFDDMAAFVGRDPDRDEFVYLLDTLAKYGYVKVATEIFNKRKQRYDLDVKVYTVLVYGWCKVGRVDMAERFLREMIEKGLEPNVVCYNIILDGICRRSSLHPDDRFDRTVGAAERVFDEMRQRGIEPDVTSYSIVLHVYSRAHKPELSIVKLGEMQGRGICPTVATYTSVIKCLSSCGRLEEAEEMLEEMARGGVSPSAMTYNCFFKEYRGRKDWGSALKLYRKMKESDGCSTVPSIHTFHILLGMFLRLGKMDVVWELWEDMGKSGVGPDLDSYTILVHWLCQMQKWRDACQFFVEMIEKGLLPQKATFETLYKGLIQSDKLRTWRRLKKKLDEESLKFGLEFQQYHLQPYRR